MAHYETARIIKDLAKKGKTLKGLSVLILGGAFKPNVPDMRNSKVENIVNELKEYGCDVSICEPYSQDKILFGVENVSLDSKNEFAIVIKAVKHKVFNEVDVDYVVL